MQPQRQPVRPLNRRPSPWNFDCTGKGSSDNARQAIHSTTSSRPPAGARGGEKVKDYPQLSIRVPVEMKARLNALSAVTGLAQWRLVVEALNCFFDHSLGVSDQALVKGLSERLLRAQ